VEFGVLRIRVFSGVVLCAVMAFGAAQAETVGDAVRRALSSNPQIKAADANYRAFAYELLERRGGFQPSVNLFADISQDYVDKPDSLSVEDNATFKTARQLGVVAEIALYDGYARANSVYAGAARLDQSAFDLLDASENLALVVVEAYINVARQRQLLIIAEQSLAKYTQIRDEARALVAGGQMPISEMLQIESRIYAAEVSIYEIRRAITTAEIRYRALVGSMPVGAISVPAPVAPPGSLDVLLKDSVSNNFLVRRSGLEVDAREFEKVVADGQFRPRVSLRSGGSLGQDLGGSSGRDNNVFVGLGLEWQLYGGERQARQQALDARKNQALYDRLAIVREVEELSGTAWATYRSAEARLKTLDMQVDVNELLVENYNEEFQVGTRSLLDLLVAEAGLDASRVEKVNNAAILSFSSYRILAAQSRLADHFGVAQSEVLLGRLIDPETGQKPLALIDKGRAVVGE